MRQHELLKLTMDAHGGLDRWTRARAISFSFQPSGPGLQARGPVGEAITRQPMRVHVDTKVPRVVVDSFLAPGQRGIYQPHRTVVERSDGAIQEELLDPRGSLKSLAAGAPWSASQLLYFVGYSLWMYITLPFSFLHDGVTLADAEPWIENGETWRALKVTYPDTFPAHATEQVHYFDARGFMRRQDYTVDVRQDLEAAHYLLDHQRFDGLWFPTERRICLRGGDGAPQWDRPLISAKLTDFEVHAG